MTIVNSYRKASDLVGFVARCFLGETRTLHKRIGLHACPDKPSCVQVDILDCRCGLKSENVSGGESGGEQKRLSQIAWLRARGHETHLPQLLAQSSN